MSTCGRTSGVCGFSSAETCTSGGSDDGAVLVTTLVGASGSAIVPLAMNPASATVQDETAWSSGGLASTPARMQLSLSSSSWAGMTTYASCIGTEPRRTLMRLSSPVASGSTRAIESALRRPDLIRILSGLRAGSAGSAYTRSTVPASRVTSWPST